MTGTQLFPEKSALTSLASSYTRGFSSALADGPIIITKHLTIPPEAPAPFSSSILFKQSLGRLAVLLQKFLALGVGGAIEHLLQLFASLFSFSQFEEGLGQEQMVGAVLRGNGHRRR